MKKHYLLILATLCLFVMVSSSFASNYGDSYGYSTKGMSLGNAMSARVDDWSSVYYNLAGLGKTRGLENGKNQIGLAYQGNMPVFDIDISRADGDGNALSTGGDQDLETGTLILGLALDANILMNMPSFISSARLGVGVTINDDMTAVKINDLDPRTHNFMRYGREAQRLEVLSGMGFGFMDDLFGFGLGINSGFGGDGVVILEDIDLDTEAQSPRGQAKMDMTLEPNLLFGMYFSPGKMIESLEGLDFGFTFRDETILDIYPFETTGVTNVGAFPLNMMLALNDYFQPRMYVLGASYATETWTLSFDLEYQEWSGFKMSDPMTENFQADLVEFDDIFIPRVGLETKINPWLNLLFGYYYQPSFVPDEAVAGVMNYLDNDKHVASAGLTLDVSEILPIKGHTELCLGYQLQYLVDRDVTKTAPTSFNPDYSYGGTCHTVMMELNINL
ncbi:MAG: hypothetical protein KKD44_20595 [Proteobacteria bacterium]|nr:hypothetical protein [Pseudomonadota bacterium]